MSQAVFLDSGIFIAFLSSQDRWHEPATALFSVVKPRWATSFLVLSETYSWLLHRHGEEAARSFHRLVDSLDGLRVFDVNRRHHEETVRMLERLRGAKLTYVDASSLCFLDQHRIRRVWSTDHHLGLTGAEVLPR